MSAPTIKLEASPTPPSKSRTPSIAEPDHPDDDAARRVRESFLRTRQEMAAFYNKGGTNYMDDVLGGGDYRAYDGHRAAIPHHTGTMPNQATSQPRPLMMPEVLQTNVSFADVLRAHKMAHEYAQRTHPATGHIYAGHGQRLAVPRSGLRQVLSDREQQLMPPGNGQRQVVAQRVITAQPAPAVGVRAVDVPAADASRKQIVNIFPSDRVNATTLPETLKFTSRDEARSALVGRSVGWSPPKNDDTVPQIDAQRRGYVLRLFHAMRNREGVMDKKPDKRWDITKAYFYEDDHMERVCWEIVHVAEELHKHGPGVLSIYDSKTLDDARKDRDLTFEDRIETLAKLLFNFKSRCDTLMKGHSLEEVVACPSLKLSQAIANKKANAQRAKIIKAGRKATLQEASIMLDDRDTEHDDADVGTGVATTRDNSVPTIIVQEETGAGNSASDPSIKQESKVDVESVIESAPEPTSRTPGFQLNPIVNASSAGAGEDSDGSTEPATKRPRLS